MYSFTESIQSYDAHGNIESLQRTGKQGSLIANYGYYDYKTGNNQLLDIRSSKESSVNLRKYSYNKTGQLIYEQQQGQSKYLQYDAYGQVIAVYADAGKTLPIVQYAYNDQGYQVLKKHYNEQGQAEKDTWYVRDASGSVLSIYEEDIVAKQPLSQIEFPVYAQGRLGMLSTRGNDEVYQYELSDHIGNVRAVISRQRQADGSIDVLYTRDYYSFGSVIEDNSRALGSYRYGYQGLYSEEDEKTSWHSFELRQYDSDIGRWLSIDPYGQYHSPYVAMGNAPNMMVDADGGWSWTTAAIGAAVGVGVGYVASGGDWRYALAGGLAGGTLGGASFNSTTKSGYFSGEINTTFSKTSYSFNPIGFSTAASLTASIARGADGYFSMQQQQIPVQNVVTVDNTNQAWDHYFDGNGTAVRIGPNTTNALLSDSDFLLRHNRIVNGQTTALTGNFSVKYDRQCFSCGTY